MDAVGGLITREQYFNALHMIVEAMGQLEPDSRVCVLCGDNDHQAWECDLNPVKMMLEAKRQRGEWRCFHCNETFTNYAAAREHFGGCDLEDAACQLKCRPFGPLTGQPMRMTCEADGTAKAKP